MNTYFDLIEKTYQELKKLIRCLEIYLDDCVAKIPVTRYSPDIKELECDSILSFNYTTIPMNQYPLLANTHYIHGRALASRSTADNNMVLGVKMNIGKILRKISVLTSISIKNLFNG